MENLHVDGCVLKKYNTKSRKENKRSRSIMVDEHNRHATVVLNNYDKTATSISTQSELMGVLGCAPKVIIQRYLNRSIGETEPVGSPYGIPLAYGSTDDVTKKYKHNGVTIEELIYGALLGLILSRGDCRLNKKAIAYLDKALDCLSDKKKQTEKERIMEKLTIRDRFVGKIREHMPECMDDDDMVEYFKKAVPKSYISEGANSFLLTHELGEFKKDGTHTVNGTKMKLDSIDSVEFCYRDREILWKPKDAPVMVQKITESKSNE